MYRIVTTEPIVIKETFLDLFGHMHHVAYLNLFEQARWDLIVDRGYDVARIRETGIGPTILEAKLSFMREVRLRDVIVIQTQLTSYEKKVGKLAQKMMRGNDLCCAGEFTFGLFNIHERKLVLPTPEWRATLELDLIMEAR